MTTKRTTARKRKTTKPKLTAAQKKRQKAAADKKLQARKRTERQEAHAKATVAGKLHEETRTGRETPAGNRGGGKWYYARRAFGYGKPGTPTLELDRGQLFQLQGCVNDARLVGGTEGGMGYCELLTRTQVRDASPCRVCGERFVDPGALNAHGGKRHEPAAAIPPLQPQQHGESDAAFNVRHDQFMEMVERQKDMQETSGPAREDRDAPLILENSAASREAVHA